MYTVTLTNTLSATEAVIDNPGAATGPKCSEYKFNTINVPMPKTNIQLPLAPGETAELTTEFVSEAVFFNNLADKIKGLTVTVSDPIVSAASEASALSNEDTGEDAGAGETDETV